jgi:uncharacterized membrane protein YfcA
MIEMLNLELIILGMLAGILAGMFGIGGGVIIVPALVVIFGFNLTLASGTSLFALMLPVGILAVIQYYKKGLISIKSSGLIAFGLALGVAFGANIAISLPITTLKQFYGIFLLYVCYNFFDISSILKKKFGKNQEIEIKEDKSRNDKIIGLLGLGLLAGVLSGLFGIGGGLVIVPFLVTFMKYDTKKAIGTSLGALLLPVGLPGVLVYYNAGNLNLNYALFVSIGLLIGAFFGANITLKLSGKLIKKVYAVFLLIVAMNFLFGAIFNK